MSKQYNPLWELFKFRWYQLVREPEAIFWAYGFPLLLTVLLGIAFRTAPIASIRVAIEESPHATSIVEALSQENEHLRFEVSVLPNDEARRQLRTARVDVMLTIDEHGAYNYHFDPARAESHAARSRVNDRLQQAAGRAEARATQDHLISEPGSRYIDFLIPGLLGMNLMAGGMFGVGFMTVDMRMRKLLKRLYATAMRRSDFLLSTIGGRMLFTVPELIVILAMGMLIFGVPIRGSWLALIIVALLGGLCFCGLGLLTACRAAKLETISGLMNVVMLPMWLLSGIFFSTETFPDAMQPFVQALPLTQLINALRAIMLDGASLASQWFPVLYMTIFGTVCFALSLRWFRWT